MSNCEDNDTSERTQLKQNANYFEIPRLYNNNVASYC